MQPWSRATGYGASETCCKHSARVRRGKGNGEVHEEVAGLWSLTAAGPGLGRPYEGQNSRSPAAAPGWARLLLPLLPPAPEPSPPQAPSYCSSPQQAVDAQAATEAAQGEYGGRRGVFGRKWGRERGRGVRWCLPRGFSRREQRRVGRDDGQVMMGYPNHHRLKF